MKHYKVNVNGTAYDVEIELIDEKTETAPKAEAPKAAPAPVSAGAQSIAAPMPGTILDVKVSNGQSVKKGDILFILEAMKMENEILASVDGTVSGISVGKGTTVATGTVLCNIA